MDVTTAETLFSINEYTTGFSTVAPVSNITRRTCPPKKLTTHQKMIWKMEVAVLSSVFTLAVLGNLCVLLVVWLRRKKRTRMHLFILHLALTDLFVAFFQVLPELVMRLRCGFFGSDFSCRLTKFLQIVGMYSSTYVLVCTAIDRYLAVRYPMLTLRSSKKRVYITIFITWLLSFLLSSPQLGLWSKDPKLPVCGMKGIKLETIQGYVTWTFISVFLIPTFLLAGFYVMIARVVVKNVKGKRKAQAHTNPVNGQGECTPRVNNIKNLTRAKIKTVKMTFVIVITFFLCWAPFFFVQLLGIWKIIKRGQLASNILHLLSSLNSCVNPWIYMGFSGHMLKDLKNTVCFWNKVPNDTSMSTYSRGTGTWKHTTLTSITEVHT